MRREKNANTTLSNNKGNVETKGNREEARKKNIRKQFKDIIAARTEGIIDAISKGNRENFDEVMLQLWKEIYGPYDQHNGNQSTGSGTAANSGKQQSNQTIAGNQKPLSPATRSELENERINLMSDLKVALSKAWNDWEMLTRRNQTCSEFVFYYQLFATKKRNLEAAVKQCQEFDKRLEELLNSYDEDSVMKLSIAAEESFQKAEALISESSDRLSSISSAEDACAITQEELEAWLSGQ